ncbi:MAG TPA: farnesyl diphosphate synthase [Pirellulales bacterium]
MISCSSAPLTEQLAAARQAIDAALERYSDLSDDCPVQLRDAIRHSLLAPCKRLRPTLVLFAAEACGSSWEAAMPAACAVEMIHTYSLIHDDLPAMDNDDLRRGRPTCHKAFGEALAILAGDALLALALEVVAKNTHPPEFAARCCAVLAEAAGPTALVGGQADDLSVQYTEGDLGMLENIHRRKTGAMFAVSLQLGGYVAGAADAEQTALERYGRKIGLAFQIADDLLDVRGDEAALGKRVGKDSEHGKLTFPGLLGVEESQRRAQRLIDEACAALAPLGEKRAGLDALARYVLERNQ